MDCNELVKQLNSVLEVVNSTPLPREDKVAIRQEKVLQLNNSGYTQIDMSHYLKCSLSTVEKDLKALRNGLLPPNRTIKPPTTWFGGIIPFYYNSNYISTNNTSNTNCNRISNSPATGIIIVCFNNCTRKKQFVSWIVWVLSLLYVEI